MAAKVKAVSSRGAAPKHEPPSNKRLTLPVNPVKPTPARVAVLGQTHNTHKEIPPEVVQATNAAISSIARSAQAELKAVDAVVPAAASAPVVQDDRHKLDLWLKQREAPGITALVKTDGVREVKLSSGETIKVEKRVDPVDVEMPASKMRPSVYHYIRNKQGKLLRVWCDASPYYWEQGVGTPCGSVCWVGVTQDRDPIAWARAKKNAIRLTENSKSRRDRRHEVKDTTLLNAAQYNTVLAPIPTVADMVKCNTKEFNEKLNVKQIMPSGNKREDYGRAMARHASLAHFYQRAVKVAEGAPPINDDKQNPFLIGLMSLGAMTGRQWWEKYHGLVAPNKQEAQPLLPWTEEPVVTTPEQGVQPPVVEVSEAVPVDDIKAFAGGYFGMRPVLEHVREVDAELPASAPEDLEKPVNTRPTKKQLRELKKQARVEKPHQLDRRKQRKLKRHQKRMMKQENEPDKGDSAIISEATEVVVISDRLPAPANQPIEETTGKSSELKPVESWAKYFERKLDDIRPGLKIMDKKFLHANVDITVCDPDGWDGVCSLALSVTAPRLQAALAYLEETMPLPTGMRVSAPTPPVLGVEGDKSFDPFEDIDDPDFDEKIASMINEEQEMLDLVTQDSKHRLRQLQWQRALGLQRHATTAEDHLSATHTILKMVSEDRREDVGQVVVAGLLPPPKMPKQMQWQDLCSSSTHLPLHRKEDYEVVHEWLGTKMERIRFTFAQHYQDAHERDLEVTRRWVGERKEFARPDSDGWSVGGAVYNQPVTIQMSRDQGGHQLLLANWKLSVLQKRKNRRRAFYGTANYRLAMRRIQHRHTMQSVSPFVRWAWKVGDETHGFKPANSKVQRVLDRNGNSHRIFSSLVPEECGYTTLPQNKVLPHQRVPLPTLLDEVIQSMALYFKPVDSTPSKKALSIQLRHKLQALREKPTKGYLKYRPSPKMTDWFRAMSLSEEARLESWLSAMLPLSVKVHPRLPRARPERPANIELHTVIVPVKKDFTVDLDSSVAALLKAGAAQLRESGIEVSTNDLKKLGLSGETASKAPEYVTVEGVLYERAKWPARRRA